MRKFSVANDIIPIGEFKTRLSKWFRDVKETGQPLIITQNGKPAAILVSPSEYDELSYNKAFLDSITRGISDAETGNVFSSKELRDELKRRRKQG
ncbi:type II toxin-antitoxin system Phd/YefM family antitoxin [Candidatus Sumerlaeota bacterium]|nr:type II toxin-antitoxin system Phd/YefM family antitoxin [Candidatus Sumerlaeota bacterium]